MNLENTNGHSISVLDIQRLELWGGALSPRVFKCIQENKEGVFSVDTDFEEPYWWRDFEALLDEDQIKLPYTAALFSEKEWMTKYFQELVSLWEQRKLSDFQIQSDALELLKKIPDNSLEEVYMDLFLTDLGPGNIFSDIWIMMQISREQDPQKRDTLEQERIRANQDNKQQRFDIIHAYLLTIHTKLQIGGVLTCMNYAPIVEYCKKDFFDTYRKNFRVQDSDQEERWLSPYGLYDYCYGGRKDIVVEKFKKINV